MSLKLRYAAFLLGVTILLLCFCVVSIYFVYHGKYLLTAIFLGILYLCTYQLGKRFARIFFLLSVLRLLRKNNGVLSFADFNGFIVKSLGSRRSIAEQEQLKEDVLTTLLEEKVVMISEDTIVLLSC